MTKTSKSSSNGYGRLLTETSAKARSPRCKMEPTPSRSHSEAICYRMTSATFSFFRRTIFRLSSTRNVDYELSPALKSLQNTLWKDQEGRDVAYGEGGTEAR